jgi:hypothetical protein
MCHQWHLGEEGDSPFISTLHKPNDLSRGSTRFMDASSDDDDPDPVTLYQLYKSLLVTIDKINLSNLPLSPTSVDVHPSNSPYTSLP